MGGEGAPIPAPAGTSEMMVYHRCLQISIKMCARTGGVVQVHPDRTVFCLFKGLLGEGLGGLG